MLINNLSKAIIFLIEKVLIYREESCKLLGINIEGYYFVSAGDLSIIDRVRTISERLGLGDIKTVSVEAAKQIYPLGHIMWGCGERTRADKLAQLGWEPKDVDWKSLMEEEGGHRA